MKYCFTILMLCVLFCACSFTQQNDGGYYSYKENGVLEEEFDLLAAPQMDYEKEIPYEDQVKATNAASAKESVKLAKPQSQKSKSKYTDEELD